MGPAFHRLLQMPIFRDGLMDYSLGNSAQQKALRLKVKPKWKLKNRAVPRIRAIKRPPPTIVNGKTYGS